MSKQNKKDYVLKAEKIIEAFADSYGNNEVELLSIHAAQKFASHFDESFAEELAKTCFEPGVNQENINDEAFGEEVGAQYGERFGVLFGVASGETLGNQCSQNVINNFKKK
ncbi:MAG TPA: hypothetical protein DCY20_09645 [Firmicutes bacterium]|nr:hypothetical protein [Bacillota bacterium]